ncbi:MAG: aminotransferase class I/II-fold pyridoxal phosphate-dependent enzyme, partial [Chroococcales cyanobacterium]
QMGTLSKALGSLGGYVAGTAALVDFLRNRAGSWIYTTGLSPADTAAGLGAIAIVNQEPQRRAKLWQNVKYLKQLLAESAPPVASRLLPSESPILCLQVPDAETVLAVGEGLKAAGILVGAVRPPTVPTSRIRVTVMATHEKAHCERLVEGLQSLLKS